MAADFASGRLLTTPENRAALTALREVLQVISSGSHEDIPSHLMLHGPTGSGKSTLIQILAEELVNAGFCVCSRSANDFTQENDHTALENSDLSIVEDLQHLPTRHEESLVRLIDERASRGAPCVFTAVPGPGSLNYRGMPMSRRLKSRLSGGLVVAIEPMQLATRRKLLDVLAKDAQLNTPPGILDWLAQQLIGGGRALVGAVRQLKTLQGLQRRPLRLDDVRAHFRDQASSSQPTVTRIAEHVSQYYGVPAKRLVSDQRSSEVLWPRQVSMYLARQLTDLSFESIGRHFGRRDHKTVHHACLKVASVVKEDVLLHSIVRRLRAELA